MGQNVNDIIIEVFILIEVLSKKKKVTILFSKLLVVLSKLVSLMRLYFKIQENRATRTKLLIFNTEFLVLSEF